MDIVFYALVTQVQNWRKRFNEFKIYLKNKPLHKHSVVICM